MNDRFHEILDELTDAAPRSRLRPYTELIRALRYRKRSYREIARVLAEKCGVRVSHSTLHEFVRRHLPNKLGGPTSSRPHPAEKMAINVKGNPTITKGEISEQIDALRRKPVAGPDESTAFHFDSSEPLRLKPGKT